MAVTTQAPLSWRAAPVLVTRGRGSSGDRHGALLVMRSGDKDPSPHYAEGPARRASYEPRPVEPGPASYGFDLVPDCAGRGLDQPPCHV